MSLFAFIFFWMTAGAKDAPQHLLEVEWEPKAKAVSYDIKLTPNTPDAKPQYFGTEKTVFKKEMTPNEYFFQVRAKYAGGQTGEWSPAALVRVLPVKVQLMYPPNNAAVSVETKGDADVTFKWSEAQDARLYRLKYWSETQLEPRVIETKDTTVTVKLPVGPVYYWKIELVTNRGVEHQNSSDTGAFHFIYGQLREVVINDIHVREESTEILWQAVEGSESFNGKLFYRPIFAEEWTPVHASPELKESKWIIAEKLIPGEYKLEILATAKNHRASKPSEKIFYIKPSAPELQPVVATDL